MSMLSTQVDELRELAEHLDERERGMDEYVTALRDAADTIWELRGSVHRERAEADRLRELVPRLYANLRNRETILELMGMPLSEAAKDEMRAIIDKCSELGIEVDE